MGTEHEGGAAFSEEAQTSESAAGEAKQPAVEVVPASSDSTKWQDSVDKEPASTGANGGSDKSQHQTIYRLLDEALEAAPPPQQDSGGRAYKHPIYVDFLLAGGLLVAVAGFTIGMMKVYIMHSAEQSITQRNYKAAITMLRDAPLPGIFQVYDKDPQDLLNQALYLEAAEKLDANGEDDSALRELQQISPGSRFFDSANQIIKEHTRPSQTQLRGSTVHQASPDDKVPEEQKRLDEQKIVIPPEDDSSSKAKSGT